MQTSKFSILLCGTLMALVLAVLPRAVFAADDYKASLEQANQDYDQAKYAEAKKRYDFIVHDGHYSAELFYNLGNTEFRLGNSGAAILNYERALALAPNHPEARANLAYVREQTGARTNEAGWQQRIIGDFDINTYCIIAAAAAWIAIFAIITALLKLRPGKAGLFFTAACALLVFAYADFAVYQLEQNRSLAIITAKSADARFAPADNSTLAAALPAGSRVWILQRGDSWVYCKLPDNSRAWISADSLERVRLNDT